ncbi:hypothetical protein GF354_04480 [Candidatus Peregrinibacteria bacterium]|nr:hypothetical protein [Candidatus Peregrinibacteria bacterium]
MKFNGVLKKAERILENPQRFTSKGIRQTEGKLRRDVQSLPIDEQVELFKTITKLKQLAAGNESILFTHKFPKPIIGEETESGLGLSSITTAEMRKKAGRKIRLVMGIEFGFKNCSSSTLAPEFDAFIGTSDRQVYDDIAYKQWNNLEFEALANCLELGRALDTFGSNDQKEGRIRYLAAKNKGHNNRSVVMGDYQIRSKNRKYNMPIHSEEAVVEQVERDIDIIKSIIFKRIRARIIDSANPYDHKVY